MDDFGRLKKIDASLSDIRKRIDFFKMINPLNRLEEEKKFFDCLKKGQTHNPYYIYKKRNLSKEREQLKEINILISGISGCATLFQRKVRELQLLIDLLETNDEEFSYYSKKVFGYPEKKHIESAFEIVQNTEQVFTDEIVSPQALAGKLKECLDEYSTGWDIVISKDIIPKVSISGAQKTVFVNARLHYTKEEIERLRVHEIEVHVLRGYNGSLQPFIIFSEGTAYYDVTEEGLGVYIEKKAGCLEKDRRQIFLYAGRTLAVDYCLKYSFFEAFRKLISFIPENLAYRMVERAKRGLSNTAKHGALTRDICYVSGLEKMERFVKDKGNIKSLFTGKIGIDDVPLVEKMIEEGILKLPELLPKILEGRWKKKKSSY